jgi:hypothetical protein
MMDFLERAAAVDTFTLLVVAMMSGWAGVLTMQALSRTLLALIFVPGFTFGALVSNYVFELNGLLPTHDRRTNIIIACTVGIIVAFLALMLLTRLTKYVAGLQFQRHRFRRDIEAATPYRRELRSV